MPLLRRQPFQREKPPPDLRPDEEVFFCKLTREVFRDYEKFFERIILCNSLVWSCAITGRSGLTYQEAEESEEKALKQLAAFPTFLQKPILFLAMKTQRSRLSDVSDDVFGFAKDRYFKGEMVECIMGAKKKAVRVINVLPPVPKSPKTPDKSMTSPLASPTATLNGDDSSSCSSSVAGGSAKKTPKSKSFIKPEQFQYVVQEHGNSKTHTVKFKLLSRKKGFFNKDKCKLYLKQSCDNIDGVWRVKQSKVKKFKLNTMEFDEIFAGPLPQFEMCEIKPKKLAASKKPEPKETSPGLSKKPKTLEKDGKKVSNEPSLTLEEIKAMREQDRVQREKEREEKVAQKLKEREELRRKFEEEKEKRKKEKAMEIEKKREERRIQAEMWREWSRHRDDMDCDDLKVLPEPTPVQCRIPVQQFGDAVMVVEFVNCFSTIFDLKASFPKGFSLKTLIDALLETDAGGLMADLLLMMLTAIFSLQEEEEQEEAELDQQGTEQEAVLDDKIGDMSLKQLIDAASTMSLVPLQTHGTTLRKLPLDNFTLTEILRMHILASGAQGNLGNAKFRYQQRGGYMPIDDAGLDFKRHESDIVNKIAVENVYDLTAGEKLKVLKMLVDQFLTYAATRDLLEDNSEKLRQLKLDLKQIQWAEQKREREEQAVRYRSRLEEKQKERDILEKRRLIKLKRREEVLRREEAAKAGTEPPPEVNTLAEEIEQAEREVNELEASLPSQEDRDVNRQQEDDTESDKKAEFGSKEKEFVENILKLQHGFAVQPLGRDRMYRRYWIFQSVSGLFVEDDDETVPASALIVGSQNPKGSLFDMSNPLAPPPKATATENKTVNSETEKDPQPAIDTKDGSDKENDSMNGSKLNISAVENGDTSLNTQTTNNTNTTPNKTDSNDQTVTTKVVNGDTITISDDDDSKSALDVKPESDSTEFVSPAANQIMHGTKFKWAFYTNPEQIDVLIASLNSRGFRENPLRHMLLENKEKIVNLISKTPTDLISIPEMEDSEEAGKSDKPKTTEWKSKGKSVTYTMQNDSAHEGLELNLREMILDLEERIHVGSLGYIRVNDRNEWREALENGAYNPSTDDPLFKEAKQEKMEIEEDPDISKEEENMTIAISKDMAKALVQIARGIEPRYMHPPLGDDEKTRQAKLKAELAKKEQMKKSKKAEKEAGDNDDEESTECGKSVMERWEESCLLSTSLAQVFLHLSTLEKSVIWSKSILHTRCRICRKKSDPEKILLCDMCDRGHHMYCLKPQLKQVPDGEWFCPDCRPKEVKHSPRKGRRRTFSEQVSSSSEDEEEQESEVEEAEAEDECSGEEENDSVCAVCSKSGTLICCDSCPLSYHLACADPPLKKVPKGKWLCQICAGTDTKSGKIKMNLGKMAKGGKKSNSKSTPSSSRQSSRTGTPRDSPDVVSQNKKRKRDESPEVSKSKLKRSAKSTSKLALDNKTDEMKPAKQKNSHSRGNTKMIQLKLIEDIVMGMMEEDEAWPFLRPVNKKDAPDYYEIIKKPMDFQTIKNKVNKFQYTDPEEIVGDVRQIFTNCIEYNKRTTQEFKAGSSMSKLFERRLKNLEESAETNGPSSKRARTK